ncbi:MAG: DNA-binding transcription factor yap1 [Watsoniomyces obsoletus]|nr:MAG: DNA-binding transcription factor yap1 [Watsoniomyces obsoletus]
MASPRPNSFNHLPNGSTPPGQANPNAGSGHGRVVQAGAARVLCVADVRGNLRSLNELAKQARADYIVHTGDFGFYDDSSLERIADKTLKHVAQYSPLISDKIKKEIQLAGQQHPPIKQRYASDQLPLSELTAFINRTYTLDVPVYTVWGACEDVRVLEKFRSGEYKIDKLHIIDEANSRLLDVGGVKLRLLGLGGAVVMHKLFDNGEGRTTIAGGQGTMWTTLLQMGELVDTANRVYDPTETRILVTHASPAREGLLNQLSVTLKADFSISAGLHFRYGSSYNEFSVNPTLDHYRGKLAASKASFNDVWETVKAEVEPAVAQNEGQQQLLQNALDIVQKMPSVANGGNPFGGPVGGTANGGGQVDESAFKNMWNFNLADASFGYLVLEVDGGRIGTEMRAQGFNFAHRGGRPGMHQTPLHANAGGLSTTSPTEKTAPPSGPAAPVQPTARQATPSAPARQPSGPSGSYGTPDGAQPPPGSRPGQGPPRNRQDSPAQRNQPAQQGGPANPNMNQNAHVNMPRPSSTPTGNTNANQSGPGNNNAERAAPPSGDVRNGAGTGNNNNNNNNDPNKPSSGTPNAPPMNANKTPRDNGNQNADRNPSSALFVAFVKDEAAARAFFPEEDRAKIVRIERHKAGAHIAQFATPEDAKAAHDRQPEERRKPAAQHGQPHVKMFQEPRERSYGGGYGGGDGGRWHGGNRSGSHSGPRGGGGYRSGGDRVASDSEGARAGGGGRGNFRDGPRGGSGGGSGRGDRPRGGRGGGGGGGGRGQGPSNNNNNNTPNHNNGPYPNATSGSNTNANANPNSGNNNSGPSTTTGPSTGGDKSSPAPASAPSSGGQS